MLPITSTVMPNWFKDKASIVFRHVNLYWSGRYLTGAELLTATQLDLENWRLQQFDPSKLEQRTRAMIEKPYYTYETEIMKASAGLTVRDTAREISFEWEQSRTRSADDAIVAYDVKTQLIHKLLERLAEKATENITQHVTEKVSGRGKGEATQDPTMGDAEQVSSECKEKAITLNDAQKPSKQNADQKKNLGTQQYLLSVDMFDASVAVMQAWKWTKDEITGIQNVKTTSKLPHPSRRLNATDYRQMIALMQQQQDHLHSVSKYTEVVWTYDPIRWPHPSLLHQWLFINLHLGVLLSENELRDYQKFLKGIIIDRVAALQYRVKPCISSNYDELDFISQARSSRNGWTVAFLHWAEADESVVQEVLFTAIALSDNMEPLLPDRVANKANPTHSINGYTQIDIALVVGHVLDERYPRRYFYGEPRVLSGIAGKVRT